MATSDNVHSDLAIPPGEYLEEVIAELNMSKDELARRMGRPASKLSAVFSGTKAITPETALQLEMVTGVPAHIWLGLETEYRLALARQRDTAQPEHLKDESRRATAYCYNELAKLGVVRQTRKPRERVDELRRFFGVVSLDAIPEIQRYRPAFRQGTVGMQGSPEALSAWLRLGEMEARVIECAPFDRDRLRASLATLRAMSPQNPEVFQPELTALLAQCGVALVLCPHFPGTGVHGATFWLSREKAVLMLTIRGAWADIFWFSLFHELGHLLNDNRRAVQLELDDAELEPSASEAAADSFARDALVPPADYARLITEGSFSGESIRAFARMLGIDPGIVVGRLQHDGHVRHDWHNKLRRRYTWAA